MSEVAVVAASRDVEVGAIAETFLLGEEVNFPGAIRHTDGLKVKGLFARKGGKGERGDEVAEGDIEVGGAGDVAVEREAHVFEIFSYGIVKDARY